MAVQQGNPTKMQVTRPDVPRRGLLRRGLGRLSSAFRRAIAATDGLAIEPQRYCD